MEKSKEIVKVAIVGCGEFSKCHIAALEELSYVTIVGVCDQDMARAEALSAIAKGSHPYHDLGELLDRERPTVAHILTPPVTHADLAIQAMQAGSHVLVEKPMALTAADADRMIEAARTNRVKLATDHNYLFNPSIQKALQLVQTGKIGRVVHVKGYYGMPGSAADYRGISGRSHWAWRLPGSAFTNFYPHMIYLAAAFLPGDLAVAGVTLGQEAVNRGLATELNVLLGGENVSANLLISMQIQPYAKYVDICGTKGIIHADLANEVCTVHKALKAPGMISKVLYNLEESSQLATGTVINTTKVLLRVMKNNPGLRNHLREFYSAIRDEREIPVRGEDGRKMVSIMEETWKHLPPSVSNPGVIEKSRTIQPRTPAERKLAESNLTDPVLVTGASGFLGFFLIKALARSGVDVRALVHNHQVPIEIEECAEVVQGDIRDRSSLEAAMRGVSIVYHCAAATRNFLPLKEHIDTNVLGTKNVLEAALSAGVNRVVHMSSVIVYGLSNGSVDENSPYATISDPYANYMRTKIDGEKLVLDFHKEFGLPVTVLRLGSLYGPVVGASFNRGLVQVGPIKAIIGSGRNHNPNLYIENAVDCILFACISDQAIGQTYNVIDEPQLTGREFFGKCDQVLGERSIKVSIPEFVMRFGAQLFEWRKGNKTEHIPPRLSRFVVRSACRDIYYSTSKVRTQLGWQPPKTLEDGLNEALAV